MINFKKINNDASYIVLLLIAFSLVFSIRATSLLSVVLAFNFISGEILFRNLKTVIRDKFVFISILFFIIHIFSLIYSSNLSEGLFSIQKKLSLILFPLVLISCPINGIKFKTVLIAFILGMLVEFILEIHILLHNSYDTFSNIRNSQLINLNRVYFSMFLYFAVMLCGYLYTNRYSKWILALLSILFILFELYVLESKMATLSFLITSLCLLIYYFLQRGIIIYLMLSLVFITIISFLILEKKGFFEEKFKYQEIQNVTSISLRLLIWESAVEIIKQHPIFGVGVGNSQALLNGEYKSRSFTHGISIKYNAHNQYLQTALEMGLIGLGIFIVILILLINKAIEQKSLIFTGFIILFILCCLSESMLTVNKGIVFFSLFGSLFYSTKQRKALPTLIYIIVTSFY